MIVSYSFSECFELFFFLPQCSHACRSIPDVAILLQEKYPNFFAHVQGTSSWRNYQIYKMVW